MVGMEADGTGNQYEVIWDLISTFEGKLIICITKVKVKEKLALKQPKLPQQSFRCKSPLETPAYGESLFAP